MSGHSTYHAPNWLYGAHLQTIWPLLIKGRLPDYRRIRWNTPDGDFIDVDVLPHRQARPLLILFHGLEGSSHSHYACSLMREADRRKWNGAVAHFRGCSGTPNRLARAYHAGDSEEIDWMLQRFAHDFPDVRRHAAGVSLGGNALLCWLGRRKQFAADLICGAAAISAPLDLAASWQRLSKGFNRLYTENFLRTLRQKTAEKARHFPSTFDAQSASLAKDLETFDDCYTAPMHGFRNAREYWGKSSASQYLQNIALPTLILNARNDPFLPPQVLPVQDEVSALVTLEQPEQGGHAGFVSGPFPGNLDWMPRRVLDYLETADAHRPEQPPGAQAEPATRKY